MIRGPQFWRNVQNSNSRLFQSVQPSIARSSAAGRSPDLQRLRSNSESKPLIGQFRFAATGFTFKGSILCHLLPALYFSTPFRGKYCHKPLEVPIHIELFGPFPTV